MDAQREVELYKKREKTRKWYQANREHVFEYNKKYRANNIDKVRKWRADSRAAKPEEWVLRECHAAMKDRCLNPKNKSYSSYGGRGIGLCDAWAQEGGFKRFCLDMGSKPSPKHSLERIDVDGNYEPGNCKWATAAEQTANRRKYKALTGFTDEEIINEAARRGFQLMQGKNDAARSTVQ